MGAVENRMFFDQMVFILWKQRVIPLDAEQAANFAQLPPISVGSVVDKRGSNRQESRLAGLVANRTGIDQLRIKPPDGTYAQAQSRLNRGFSVI